MFFPHGRMYVATQLCQHHFRQSPSLPRHTRLASDMKTWIYCYALYSVQFVCWSIPRWLPYFPWLAPYSTSCYLGIKSFHLIFYLFNSVWASLGPFKFCSNPHILLGYCWKFIKITFNISINLRRLFVILCFPIKKLAYLTLNIFVLSYYGDSIHFSNCLFIVFYTSFVTFTHKHWKIKSCCLWLHFINFHF